MDQMRLMIALVLSFVVFLGWNFFFPQEAKQPPASPPQQAAKPETIQAPAASAVAAKPAAEGSAAVVGADKPARRLTVETPLYTVGLSEKGAVINSFVLKDYHEGVEKDSPLLNLFPGDGSLGTLYVGLKGIPGLANAVYQAGVADERISLTQGTREIVFGLKLANGMQVEKVYRFSADSYVMGFDVRVMNGSEQPVSESLSIAMREAYPAKKNANVFEGPSALINKSLETIELDDIAKKNTLTGKIAWVALQSRYFTTSLIPLKEEEASLRLALMPGNVVEAQYDSPEQVLAPNSRQSFEFLLFFGPKSMNAVMPAGHQLERIVDFGMFDILAKPCLWLLNYIYGVIPNYGVAIIILTILSKIILWPLGTKSYKSMSQMKKLQPLIQEIRDKYKNDRKKMNEEVMRLHKTYSINPVGGCLPMILQIPVFFALYRMLDQAIELRHAHFLWWINDLSAPDRLFNFDFSIPFMEPPFGIPVLTLVMGATMFWQQKMAPPAGDPAQAKMMLMMPVVFTFIFINFSAGLVLYWLVNNVLSIAQQSYVQKKYA
ncbi:MAG TPA: membrane protein insertase YidC [Desulfobacterales bacterium]|nr:membrane protein insertase YidC [Desulfobacterales bacterium]